MTPNYTVLAEFQKEVSCNELVWWRLYSIVKYHIECTAFYLLISVGIFPTFAVSHFKGIQNLDFSCKYFFAIRCRQSQTSLTTSLAQSVTLSLVNI